jgi:S1 RNA binding domain protein
MPVEIGKVVEGTVTGITHFGAFIKLPEGQTGLCHISEVADDYVKNIKAYLRERQKVKVKIINIDKEGKISLSIRKAQEKPLKKSSRPIEIDWGNQNNDEHLSFEDKLSKFLKDSDEKQQEIKKHFKDSRKGNGFNKVNTRREFAK